MERIDPDYNPTDKEIDDVAKLLSQAKGRMAYFSYHENGNGFQKWLLVVAASLAVAGVGGSIMMYGRLAAIEQQLADLKSELSDVKKLVEPRFRGR